jgi:hypothetical protein
VADIDDEDRLLAALRVLPQGERDIVLAVLRLALVLDGRLTRRDRALWRAAQAACGLPPDDHPLREARARFVRGQGEAAGERVGVE